MKKLEAVLSLYVDESIKSCIIKDYIPNLIPPGTKGVIRGNKFNTIIKEKILSFKISEENFDIMFEKNARIILQLRYPTGIY